MTHFLGNGWEGKNVNCITLGARGGGFKTDMCYVFESGWKGGEISEKEISKKVMENVDGKGCYILPFAEVNSDELHSVGRL